MYYVVRRFGLLCAILLNVFAVSAQTGWEGLAAQGSAEDFPVRGQWALANDFPAGTIINVTNVANNRRISVRIIGRSNNNNYFLLLSAEAARNLGISAQFPGRVQVGLTNDSVRNFESTIPPSTIEEFSQFPSRPISPLPPTFFSAPLATSVSPLRSAPSSSGIASAIEVPAGVDSGKEAGELVAIADEGLARSNIRVNRIGWGGDSAVEVISLGKNDHKRIPIGTMESSSPRSDRADEEEPALSSEARVSELETSDLLLVERGDVVVAVASSLPLGIPPNNSASLLPIDGSQSGDKRIPNTVGFDLPPPSGRISHLIEPTISNQNQLSSSNPFVASASASVPPALSDSDPLPPVSAFVTERAVKPEQEERQRVSEDVAVIAALPAPVTALPVPVAALPVPVEQPQQVVALPVPVEQPQQSEIVESRENPEQDLFRIEETSDQITMSALLPESELPEKMIATLDRNAMYIQVGAFRNARAAEEIAEKLKQQGYDTFVYHGQSQASQLNRILVGPIPVDEVGSLLVWIRSQGFSDAFSQKGSAL